jgi:hypothetical protein
LLQSLVQGLCVAAEKRETGRTKEKKEVAAVQKNLAAETKERTKDKKRERRKSEYLCCCSKLILCDYICVQAHVSKQDLA